MRSISWKIVSSVFLFLALMPSAAGEEAETLAETSPIRDTATQFGQPSVDFTWLFLKTLFAMVVVIGLAIIVIRFLIPKISLQRRRQSSIDLEILDRIPLDSKKALYVLQVEGRRLLISSSENHVGLIAELEGKNE